MKIIATVRTRNEEANIARFCNAYQHVADEILVADGGSTDGTVEIAERYWNVDVLHFEEQMDVKGGLSINPQGKHVNFLIREARERGADWIIFDDCDCVPNYILRRDVRTVIETAEGRGNLSVFTRRIFMWGEDFHFPLMHKPNTSMWAFHANKQNVRADEDDPWHLRMTWNSESGLHNLRPRALHLEPPYCLLHFTWQSEEATRAKLDWYHKSGVQPTALHPRKFAGEIEPVEPFMKVFEPPK